MSSYVNPSYVNKQSTYIAQSTGVQPISAPYTPSYCPAPVASKGKHHYGYHRFNETGTILVLFILLVIISRAWLI